MSNSHYVDLPARGAEKMPSRSELEKQPLVASPYPSVRYHPDGTHFTVNSEDEDRALGKPWSAKRYPTPPPAPVPVPPTLDELKAAAVDHEKRIAALEAAVAGSMLELLEMRQRDAQLIQAHQSEARPAQPSEAKDETPADVKEHAETKAAKAKSPKAEK